MRKLLVGFVACVVVACFHVEVGSYDKFDDAIFRSRAYTACREECRKQAPMEAVRSGRHEADIDRECFNKCACTYGFKKDCN